MSDIERDLATLREALTWIKDHHDGVPEAEAALARIEQRIGELERVVEAAEGLRHSPGADCWCPWLRVANNHTEECEAMRLAIAALDGKEER